MYKTFSINRITSEFFHFWRLPSPTEGSASGDLDVLAGVGSHRDLSGRSSGSQFRTGPNPGTGMGGGAAPKAWDPEEL